MKMLTRINRQGRCLFALFLLFLCVSKFDFYFIQFCLCSKIFFICVCKDSLYNFPFRTLPWKTWNSSKMKNELKVWKNANKNQLGKQRGRRRLSWGWKFISIYYVLQYARWNAYKVLNSKFTRSCISVIWILVQSDSNETTNIFLFQSEKMFLVNVKFNSCQKLKDWKAEAYKKVPSLQ